MRLSESLANINTKTVAELAAMGSAVATKQLSKLKSLESIDKLPGVNVEILEKERERRGHLVMAILRTARDVNGILKDSYRNRKPFSEFEERIVKRSRQRIPIWYAEVEHLLKKHERKEVFEAMCWDE